MIDHRPDWSRFDGRVKRRGDALTAQELAALGARRTRLLDRMQEAYGGGRPGRHANPAARPGAGHAAPRPAEPVRAPAD